MLTKSQYLSSLAENAEQFRVAAELGLEPRVNSCPEWTVGQLVVHLGDVYDFWARIVESAAASDGDVERIYGDLIKERKTRSHEQIEKSPRAIEYFQDRAGNIQRVLEAVDPGGANWTWWPGNQTAGFVQRRMAHETTVHRWDVQAAHGVARSITPPAIASDGIDEYLTNGLTEWPPGNQAYPNASFHVHCTDTEGEWLIVAKGDSVQLSREHAKADLAVTGTASEILLWLWERIDPERLAVHGDEGLLESLRGMVDRD